MTDDELHAGRLLGPYELLVPMGSGGMAHVWAARHRGNGQIFALKMLMPHLAENTSFQQMFFDEARIASRIRHENVAATYELVELEGILTLVMEWVDGSSLVHVLRPGPEDSEEHPRVALPIRHAVKILAETCAGLQAAHDLVGENGRLLSVVHRDVSPHNILLTLDGRVKVTDFGVAKALGKLHMTIAGQVKGKLSYMSPEQLVGGGVDRRSDVFALGSVLYETTTGRRPFEGDHDPQVMSAIIMGNFDPPSAVVPSYPKDLEKILLRAMATEPDARYATAALLRQALEGWLSTSGPKIGATQIALLLHERCGPELTLRADVLSLPPPVPPALSVSPEPMVGKADGTRIESGGAMEVDRRSLAAARRPAMGLLGSVMAILLGLTLGLGVLFYVKQARRARAAAVLEPATTTPTVATTMAPGTPTGAPAVSSGAPTSLPNPRPAGVASAPVTLGDVDDVPPAAAPTPGSRDVKLVIPEGARVFVDNRQFPPGTTSIPRPDAGGRTVLVRVDGKEDAIFIVNPSSPDEIEVTLYPKKRPTLRPNPVATVAMPPNPYD